MDEFEEFKLKLERMALKKCCKEVGIPDYIHEFMDCLVKCGCPVQAVLDGFKEFADRQAVKELLKELPIELED